MNNQYICIYIYMCVYYCNWLYMLPQLSISLSDKMNTAMYTFLNISINFKYEYTTKWHKQNLSITSYSWFACFITCFCVNYNGYKQWLVDLPIGTEVWGLYPRHPIITWGSGAIDLMVPSASCGCGDSEVALAPRCNFHLQWLHGG